MGALFPPLGLACVCACVRVCVRVFECAHVCVRVYERARVCMCAYVCESKRKGPFQAAHPQLANQPLPNRRQGHQCISTPTSAQCRHCCNVQIRAEDSWWGDLARGLLWQGPLALCTPVRACAHPCAVRAHMQHVSMSTCVCVPLPPPHLFTPTRPLCVQVFFEDALEHLTRIQRTIRLQQGNCLLVGVGGSGKQSLSKLAAYTAGCEVRAHALRGVCACSCVCACGYMCVQACLHRTPQAARCVRMPCAACVPARVCVHMGTCACEFVCTVHRRLQGACACRVRHL